MDELDLTMDQYKKALKEILETDMVVREHHLFGGARMTHLRLNDEGRRFVSMVSVFNTGDTIEAFLKMAGVGNPTIPMGDIPPDPMGGIPTTHKEEQGETYRERLQGVGLTAKEVEVTKMADTLQTVGAKRSKSADRKKTIGTELYEVWCSVIPEVYGGYVAPWSGKDRSMATSFAAACPHGKYLEIFEKALRNWDLLMVYLEKNTGLYKPPAKPQVWILLNKVQGVVDFCNEIGHTQSKEETEDFGFAMTTDDFAAKGT